MSRSAYDPRLFFASTPSGRHALTFIGLPPPNPETSATVLGWLRTGEAKGQPPINDAINPAAFEENPAFLSLAHEVMRQVAGHSVFLRSTAAARGAEGYVHISDERNSPAANRTPEPDDILGSLLVREGDEGPYIDAATYEPNSFYRVCTRDGMMRINDELHRALVAAMDGQREVEEGLAEDAQLNAQS